MSLKNESFKVSHAKNWCGALIIRYYLNLHIGYFNICYHMSAIQLQTPLRWRVNAYDTQVYSWLSFWNYRMPLIESLIFSMLRRLDRTRYLWFLGYLYSLSTFKYAHIKNLAVQNEAESPLSRQVQPYTKVNILKASITVLSVQIQTDSHMEFTLPILEAVLWTFRSV